MIRQELDHLLNNYKIPNFQEVSQEQEMLTNDDKWKTFFMYAYGHKIKENCIKCPQTTKALEKIPGIKTAFFSILYPHKHIPPHRGPFNGVLRYHLGLILPLEQKTCGIRVGNQIRYWEEGKSLIFDDTWEHEAWNNSDEVRIILFVDFLRPLSYPAKYFNEWIIKFISQSPFVQDGLKNLKEWNQKNKKLH